MNPTEAKTGAITLGRFLAGGALRLIAGSEDDLNVIAETMMQDEIEDTRVTFGSLPPADRKIWRARAKAALRGLDRVVADATHR